MKTLNFLPNKIATANLSFLLAKMLEQNMEIDIDGFFTGTCLSQEGSSAELVIQSTLKISLRDLCAAIFLPVTAIEWQPYSAKLVDKSDKLSIEIAYPDQDLDREQSYDLTCTLDVSDINPSGKLPVRPAYIVDNLIDDLEDALDQEYPRLPYFNHGLAFGLRISDLRRGCMLTYISAQRQSHRNRIRERVEVTRINSHVLSALKNGKICSSPIAVVEYFNELAARQESTAIYASQIVEIFP